MNIMRRTLVALPMITGLAAAQSWVQNGSSGNYYWSNLNSFIGVGTNTPLYKLDIVTGANTDQLRLRSTAANGAPLLKLSGGYNSGNGAEFWQNGNGDVRININGSKTGITISEAGNVGIGIGGALPTERLDILGGIRMTDGVNGTLRLYGDSEGARLQVGKLQGGTRDFRIVDETSGETLRITSDGFFGVMGQSIASWQKTNKTISIGDVMGGDDVRAGGAGENLAFRTKDRDAGKFNALGWFAIGNASDPAVSNEIAAPRTELDVRDSYTDSDNRADLWLSGSAGGGGVLRYFEGQVERATIRSDDVNNPGGLSIQTGGTTSNGPQSKVFIRANGDVKFNGAVEVASVKTNSWSVSPPDYVFEKDYKLASLEQVESFVEKNKHLPEVPSARELTAKGMDLSEMNFILLRKVEELTLHAIRQEKELKRQSEQIRSLTRGRPGSPSPEYRPRPGRNADGVEAK